MRAVLPDNETNNTALADMIVDSGVYTLFWDKPKSEWQVTEQGRICPAYCNLRSLIGNTKLRDAVEDALVEHVAVKLEKYPDVVCGVVSSGVPWATLLSKRLDLPMCYARPKMKKHGNNSSLEGGLSSGMKALIIDDVFSTGATIRKTSFQLGSAGVDITNVLVILLLGGKEVRVHESSGSFATLHVDYLLNQNDLVDAALRKGMMNEDQASQLRSYYEDPETQPWE